LSGNKKRKNSTEHSGRTVFFIEMIPQENETIKRTANSPYLYFPLTAEGEHGNQAKTKKSCKERNETVSGETGREKVTIKRKS